MNNLGHFLNSRAWAEFRQGLGEQTRHREADQWSYLGLIQSTGGFKKFYCPYSPVVYQAEGLAELMADIDTEAKKAHAMVTQIEPLGAITADDLTNYGYTKIKSIQPELTWVLDLTQEREQILAGMASSNRNIYRNYYKKGLEFAQTESMDDVDTVLGLIEAVAKHNQAHLHQSSYLRRQAEVLMASGAMRCFVVRLEGKVIAGALVYDDQTTRYYAHAAADYEHRKLKAGVIFMGSQIVLTQITLGRASRRLKKASVAKKNAIWALGKKSIVPYSIACTVCCEVCARRCGSSYIRERRQAGLNS